MDSNGRVVIPQEIRERLGFTPGTEVEIREEDRGLIIEPADDPERVLERMERLVTQAATDRRDMTPLDDQSDPIARDHRRAVRNGGEQPA